LNSDGVLIHASFAKRLFPSLIELPETQWLADKVGLNRRLLFLALFAPLASLLCDGRSSQQTLDCFLEVQGLQRQTAKRDAPWGDPCPLAGSLGRVSN
jgi:hypothetical protein